MRRFLMATILVAGCTEEKPREATASIQTSSVDKWMGLWIGPEGTSLTLSKSGERYAIKMQTLDGPNEFVGQSKGDAIQFVRNDQVESIRATDGKGTGMKWLAEKTNCLAIKVGEGFCRE
jgi:hypothetical protein